MGALLGRSNNLSVKSKKICNYADALEKWKIGMV